MRLEVIAKLVLRSNGCAAEVQGFARHSVRWSNSVHRSRVVLEHDDRSAIVVVRCKEPLAVEFVREPLQES